MFDKASGKFFTNKGTGQFIVGMTLKQALNLANLPATGGSLTVSLPGEAIIDAKVQSALNTAADKGWTIVVQYREPDYSTAGNIEVDFLESTGTQYIDTGYVPDNESGILLDQEKLSLGDLVPIGSRTNSGNNTRFYAIRSLNVADVGCNAGYGWGNWYVVNEMHGRQTSKLNFMNSRKVEGGGSSVHLPELPFVPAQPIYMFAANVAGEPKHIWGGRIYETSISQGESVAMRFVPRLNLVGTPCMHDTVSGQNFYNKGGGSFIAGFETTEKAAMSISKLPSIANGTLTISLPAAAKDEATLVPEAINSAKNRGWTIIAQYRED